MQLDVKQLLFFLFALYLTTRLTSSLFHFLHVRRFARQNHCLPPKRIPAKLPRGLDKWLGMILAARRGRILQHVYSRYATYGPNWTMPFFFTDSIGTIEPENIKTILASNFKDFGLGAHRHHNFAPLLGDGIFTLDGAGWEASRAMLRPQFARDQIDHLEALEVHVNRLLDRIREGRVMDMQPLFFSLTLDSATEFLFGESVDSLLEGGDGGGTDNAGTGGSEYGKAEFGKAFDDAQDFIVWRTRFQKLYWLFNSPSFRKNCATVHRFADHFVDAALHPEKRTHQPEKAGGEVKRDGSSRKRYIFSEALAEKTRDPKVLRDQILNVLLAGRDTTAGLLGFTFYLLARHPKVYDRLRKEVLDAFGTETAASGQNGGDGEVPTFASLKDVAYLRYVMNEVLRLYPSVPLNSRIAGKDTVLPVGGGPDGRSPIAVPKGQRIDYSVYALHRRKDIYGEDALEFRPERWAETTIGKGWEYLPFNGGPRICLGQQYALTEASYTVVRILQTYSSCAPADAETELGIVSNLTIATKKCLVRFWE